ncbi:TetR/AcrR family transcriptional regulator [Exiguobacterium sp. TNDT2]|uniref:TetR/AcrR family transcriptional regulator n=1 Tax=Exiguobacterium sp. TNDT2 TaxID=2233531 RepID=UPI000DEFE566|nr:TetR/AcrR family transcriptional regulator [Exiguobacterium sp. TNDT2]
MSKKQSLLRTAAAIIQQDGIQQLSMERLAKRAGITKGGVLYHFDSKSNLLQQMNKMAIEEFETRINQHLTDAPYPFTRAYALATLDYLAAEDADLIAVFISSQEDKMSGKLWTDASLRWDEQFAADGLDADRVLELRLLCDGFWFAMTYGYSDSFKDRAARIIREKSDALAKGTS